VIDVADLAAGVAFAVRVTPRASRDAIEGEYQGALKLRVTAPPVDGRANEAVRALLAERLKVPISAVRILGGETSRNKRVQIAGITRQQLMALLE
jgi:uncharacterized protein (TIGR00251 family)